MDEERERSRLVRVVRRRLLAVGLPRLEMALVAALTGAAGFVASAGLLAAGVDRMPVRYGLAVVVAYLVLFLVLRAWILAWKRGMRDDLSVLDLQDVEFPDAGFEGGGGSFGGGGASSAFGPPQRSETAVPDIDLDPGEGIVIAVVLALVASVLVASLWMVWTAPTLFAEVLVDAGISVGLYRRFRRAAEGSWLLTAFRHTAVPFAVVLVVFVLGGAYLQSKFPEARSLGDVVEAARAPGTTRSDRVE
jgi:hypothetical protein